MLYVGMTDDLSSIHSTPSPVHTLPGHGEKLEMSQVISWDFSPIFCLCGGSLTLCVFYWLAQNRMCFIFSCWKEQAWQLSLLGNLWVLFRAAARPSLDRPRSCSALKKEMERLLFFSYCSSRSCEICCSFATVNLGSEWLNALHKKEEKAKSEPLGSWTYQWLPRKNVSTNKQTCLHLLSAVKNNIPVVA